MRTIAFVTQKGGSGKSTLTSSLAVAAHQAGEKVFILDMDAQQSLTRWSQVRGKSDIAVEAVAPGKVGAVLAALAKKGITLVLIDTPGGESAAAEAAMKAADLCVIPARPNAFDLWSSEMTRRTLKALKRDYAFLLNQCPPAQQTARVEQGAAALEAMGGLITPMISARVDFQEAARRGLGAGEVAPSGDAADEMRKLWASLKRRFAKQAAPKKKAA